MNKVYTKNMIVILVVGVVIIVAMIFGYRSEINTVTQDPEVRTIETDTFQFKYPAEAHADWKEIAMKVDEGYWPSKPQNQSGIRYFSGGELINNMQTIVFRLEGHGTSIEVSFAPVIGASTMIVDSFKEASIK